MYHSRLHTAMASMALTSIMLALTGCGSVDIWQAAKFGKYHEIERMLNENPQLINAQDKSGWTPLIHAVSGKQTRVVKQLLDRGADPRIRAGSNWDALHEAKRQNRGAILKMIENRIDEANQVENPK